MPRDRMSPRERFGAFLGGKPVDRFLCVPLILNHAARLVDVPVGRYNSEATLMADCHVRAYRRYGHDLIALFSDTAVLAEAMGTELQFLPDDVPRVHHPAVPTPTDRARLHRADVQRDGRIPMLLEATRLCVADVGGEAPVSCCVPAPFTTAACLRGTDQLARDLYRNPKLAHELIAMSLDAARDFSNAILDSGGLPVIVDPVATGSLLGPRQFEEFALPYLRELHATIARRGVPVVLHICGQTSRILESMACANANLLSLDDISMSEARDRIAGRTALMGNVRPAQTLLKGRPEAVRAEVRELCAIGRACAGGFILGSGCEVPIASPPANIDAMMDAVREYGAFN